MRARKLSRAQENVAKSLILDNLHGSVSIAELAEALQAFPRLLHPRIPRNDGHDTLSMAATRED